MRAFAYESHALSCYRAGSLVELFIEENKKRGCGCWAAAATADAGKLEVLKTVEAACLQPLPFLLPLLIFGGLDSGRLKVLVNLLLLLLLLPMLSAAAVACAFASSL